MVFRSDQPRWRALLLLTERIYLIRCKLSLVESVASDAAMQAAVHGEGLASVAGRRHLCCFVNNKLDSFSEDRRPSIINRPISNKPNPLTTKQ
jgi:hypothetical protein